MGIGFVTSLYACTIGIFQHHHYLQIHCGYRLRHLFICLHYRCFSTPPLFGCGHLCGFPHGGGVETPWVQAYKEVVKSIPTVNLLNLVHARSSDTSHSRTRQSDPTIWDSVIQLTKSARGCRTKGRMTLCCDASLGDIITKTVVYILKLPTSMLS